MVAPVEPDLRLERARLRAGSPSVAGVDEVGRGALAGPVTVGVVVIARSRRPPAGLRDSKLLSAAAREALVPEIRAWADACSVGSAAPAEIDRWGIVPALRLAAERAIAALPTIPGHIVLDGSHDWLRRAPRVAASPEIASCTSVETRVGADLRCATVAAASVLAKVDRDAQMDDLARSFPRYGWERNRGYASEDHRAAIVADGPSPHHRVTWRLLPEGEQMGMEDLLEGDGST